MSLVLDIYKPVQDVKIHECKEEEIIIIQLNENKQYREK